MSRLLRALSRARLIDEAGFGLVELIAASGVLLVGMLGVLAMMTGANKITVTNRGREGATNLHRELVERARSLPYARLTQASVYTDLQALPGLEDSSSESGYQVRRRDFGYTVTLNVCSVDDPKDGYGAHDNALFCSGSSTGTQDTNPDDYKVLTVDLAWADGKGAGSSRQQTLINSPGTNVGPSITSITLDGIANTVVTTPMSSVNVVVGVNSTASTVVISEDGKVQGNATGSGLVWNYPWQISELVDGNYVVGARAFDLLSRPGPLRSITVTLNRFAPAAPKGLAVGWNGDVVEAEWLANKERDIVGYRLYRDGTLVASCSQIQATNCQDTTAPVIPSLIYVLKALDRDPSGALREGASSITINVTRANLPPNPPATLTATTNSQGDAVLTWTPASVPDPNEGDSIAFYRIYRDGVEVDNRYARTPLGTDLTWADPGAADEEHDYWVSAVDTQLAESTLVGPVEAGD